MSEFRTALGVSYELERRLPRLGWRPEMRGRFGSKKKKRGDGIDVDDLADLVPSGGGSGSSVGGGSGGGGSWLPDFGGDDLGVLAVVGVLVVAVLAIVILLPLLLFVAEVALVVALIVPLTIIGLTLGLKRHSVVLTRKSDGVVVDSRDVRGLLGSIRAGRELKAAAINGGYTLAKAPSAPPAFPPRG